MRLSADNIEIGAQYNWLHQSEKLIYLGLDGCWHQFAKVDDPGVVWCEVLSHELHMLEKSND